MPRPGVVPRFSDPEVVALGMAAEAIGIDSEFLLFSKLKEYRRKMPHLIFRWQYNDRHKPTVPLCQRIRQRMARRWMVEDCFCIDSKPIVAGRHAPSTARWAGRTRGKPPPTDTAPGTKSVGSARPKPPARPKLQFSSKPLHTNPPLQTCQRWVGGFSLSFGLFSFSFAPLKRGNNW